MEEKIVNTDSTTTKKITPLGTFFLFSLLLLFAVMAYSFWNSRTVSLTAPPELLGVLRPEPKPLSAMELVKHDGTVFSTEQLEGKWTFVFFGYTSCPDVCPMTLSILKAVDEHLDASGDSKDTQTLFVSVDPERDTAEKIAEYIAFFNQDFIGATGSKSEIDKFAQQCSAGYIIEPESAPGVYQVSHTSAIFLIDPNANLVATFSQPHNPQTIVQQYFQIRNHFQ